jgi:CMP-N,N'-diacetyllegionaminic acid synthase
LNLLFTICARAGSKGLASKNIRILNNHPLCYYTIQAYEKFKETYGENYSEIDLSVNTDSIELISQVESIGVEYIRAGRKEELAGDSVSKIDVIKDTLKQAETTSKKVYDVIIDLDLTSPLRTHKDICTALDLLLEDELTDVVFSAVPSRRNPWFNMVAKREDGYYSSVNAGKYVTRQSTPECLDMNASIYAYRRGFLINQDKVHLFDGKAKAFLMEDWGVLDIDNEKDFLLLELIQKHMFDNQ